MKRSVTRLVSMVLLLALLTACGTDPASSSETTGGSTERQETAAQPPEEAPERPVTVEELDLPDPPEQTAEERQAEFLAFLEEINAQRRAIYEAPDPPSFDESWTTDLAALDGGFTREEMDRILTKRAAAAVSAEQAREDVETAFLLLKHCYGAYDYFGGDQVFLPLKEAALEALPESAGPDAYDGLPLREAIGRLPETLRTVVILRYFTGYTQAETAAALGVPQGTVATRQRRALELLRLELGEEETP